jgi:predicted acyltransferase
MVSLTIGETGFFKKLFTAFPNPVTELFAYQFEHSDWHGLRFWDVILPGFMLIAGTSLAYSYKRQKELGYSWSDSFKKTLKRSFWLLFWGILIYAVRDGHLNWQLSNVLTQLSFTTFVAFLFINRSPVVQFTASILCLIIPEILYRTILMPGFDQPFVEFHNFGSYMNQVMGISVDAQHKTTTINCIASSAHTIWGVMVGQLFMTNKTVKQKITWLIVGGVAAILLGVGMDLSGITPILKWMSTSSFVLVTGGITLIVLAVSYYLIDGLGRKNNLQFFTIVGMNSIFIYLFFIFIGDHWLNGYMDTLVSGLLSFAGVSVAIGSALSCLVVFAIEWYLCYFLYRKKLFFKI